MKNQLLFLLTLITCFSCASPGLEFEKKSGAKNPVEAGKPFHVNLPENHTTPYLWSIGNEFDGGLIRYMGSVFHSNEKGVDFNFEAVKSGKTEVTFYLRSYSDTSAVKTFVVEVK